MKKRNFLAVLASCAVVAGMFPMTASAENVKYSPNIDGVKTVSFEKYLVMKKDVKVPTAEFSFTVEAGEHVVAEDGKMEVLAGVGTPKFVGSGKAEFTSADTVAAESDAGDKTVKFVTTGEGYDNDEQFVAKSVTVDFSDVVFTEPGVYRYIVKENSSDVTGVTNDEQNTRTLDVYVVDDSDDTGRKLKVNSYVIHTGLEAPERNAVNTETGEYKVTADRLDNKSTGFTNTYSTQNLEFGKEVTGNQGSKDKYFKFTLTVKNAAGATLDVVPLGMEANPVVNTATAYGADIMGNANSIDENDTLGGQQIVIDETGTVTKDFYLNDGQYVKIVGLPANSVYTVTELPEDYDPKYGTEKVWDTESSKTYNDHTSGTIAAADIHTGFTNNRSGAIPTGIILSVAAPVAIGVAVLGGIVFLVIKNKKRDAEEEE